MSTVQLTRSYREQRTEIIQSVRDQMTSFIDTNPVRAQLRQLQENFEELRDTARGLGLSTSALTRSYQQQRAEILASFRDEMADFAQTNPVLAQLDQLQDRFRELHRTASQLGISTAQLTRSYNEQRAEIVQNFRDQMRAAINDNEVSNAIQDVKDRFGDLIKTARGLGLATHGLVAARDRELKQIRDNVLADRESAIRDSPLYDALRELDDRFQSLYRASEALGLSTAGLVLARQREQREIIEQFKTREREMTRQLSDQVRGVQDFFRDMIEPLQAVNQNISAANPLGQIETARRDFRETLALAQGGDADATRRLASVAQGLQGLSGQYLGSGGLGAEIAEEITRGTGSLIDKLRQQESQTLASLPQVQRETVAEQIRVMVEQFTLLRAELDKLRRELTRPQRAA
jgi:hypothetical protein